MRVFENPLNPAQNKIEYRKISISSSIKIVLKQSSSLPLPHS
jgi:hypothetical protein